MVIEESCFIVIVRVELTVRVGYATIRCVIMSPNSSSESSIFAEQDRRTRSKFIVNLGIIASSRSQAEGCSCQEKRFVNCCGSHSFTQSLFLKNCSED